MSSYVRRQFAIGSEESLVCLMRLEEYEGTTLVVLKEEGHQRLRGALTARFEYVANMVALELTLRGQSRQSLRFFQEHPDFNNGKVQRPTLVQEVQMSIRDGQYCYARWAPLDASISTVVNESSCLQMEERRTL